MCRCPPGPSPSRLRLPLVLALAASAAASAAELPVGSPADLARAAAAARPGDALVVRNGTCRDWEVVFRASGAAGNPVVLRPQTPGGATFTGRTRLAIEGAYLEVSGFRFDKAQNGRGVPIVEFRGASDCRLTDCAFSACGDPHATSTRTIQLAHGSARNRVDHCFMTGTLSMGMGIKVGDDAAGRGNTDNRFDRNYFRDIRRLSPNGQEPVQLGQDQSAFGEIPIRAVVEQNLFEAADGDSEVVSNKSAGNIIRHNTLRDCQAGLCLRGGRDCRVEGNWCFRTEGLRVFGRGHVVVNNYFEETEDGIGLPAGQYRAGGFVDRASSGSYEAASGVLVAHNTVVRPKKRGIDLGRDRGQVHQGVPKNELPRDVAVANNLVVGDRGILVQVSGAENVRWQGNLVWAAGQADAGLSDPGIRRADPGLVRDGRLWRLPRTGSPAADAGVALQEVSRDIDGQDRTGPPDVGCDEISGGDVVHRPLCPEDVGPSWMRGKP